MGHTPFTRDIPVERLYTSPQIEDALGKLVYVVGHQMFAVVTANPGCGKSTMVRMLDGRLGKEKYLLLYLSDSKLAPRWLYAGLLGQLGLEAHYFSGDSKRLLQKEIRAVSTEQKKKVVCVLDEVYKISAGIPRMINRVCEKALMYGMERGKAQYIVDAVMAYQNGGQAGVSVLSRVGGLADYKTIRKIVLQVIEERENRAYSSNRTAAGAMETVEQPGTVGADEMLNLDDDANDCHDNQYPASFKISHHQCTDDCQNR